MSTDCPHGHPTVYQALSGGQEVYCETCDEVYLIRHCEEARREEA